MAEISARELLDLKQWQKIQDLFSEIIGANLWLIEPSGTFLSDPSKVNPFCREVSPTKKPPGAVQPNCVLKAFQNWLQSKEESFQCPHRFSFFALPIDLRNGKTLAVVTVGPLLMGKREDEKVYREMCVKEKIDFHAFMEQVREMRVFSHIGVRVVIEFLKELSQYLIRLAYQKEELERLIPGFLGAQKGESLFSVTYSSLLANYLLEIASEVVRADSGSVLLVDENQENLTIRSARGIPASILKKRHVPLGSGVAGWVLARKKPVLIGPGAAGLVPKDKLKRPQIKSSIVVPLEFKKKALGVFCVNSKAANKQFNQENLVLLDQLGKLASVALARVSAN